MYTMVTTANNMVVNTQSCWEFVIILITHTQKVNYVRRYIYIYGYIYIYTHTHIHRASLVAQRLKHLPPMPETRVWSLGREDPLEKEMVTHSSILAWRIPWTEKPGRLQSTGSQRVWHDWATSLEIDRYIYNYLGLGWSVCNVSVCQIIRVYCLFPIIPYKVKNLRGKQKPARLSAFLFQWSIAV